MKEKTQLSIYRSKIFNEQIEFLQKELGENPSMLVRRAIDRLYQEVKNKKDISEKN